MDVSGFAPGTFCLYIKEIGFFFFFFEVCSIRQLLNLKKTNKQKTTHLSHNPPTKKKKNKNNTKPQLLLFTVNRGGGTMKKQHNIFLTQELQKLAKVRWTFAELVTETPKAKEQLTLKVTMCAQSVNVVYYMQCMRQRWFELHEKN